MFAPTFAPTFAPSITPAIMLVGTCSKISLNHSKKMNEMISIIEYE